MDGWGEEQVPSPAVPFDFLAKHSRIVLFARMRAAP